MLAEQAAAMPLAAQPGQVRQLACRHAMGSLCLLLQGMLSMEAHRTRCQHHLAHRVTQSLNAVVNKMTLYSSSNRSTNNSSMIVRPAMISCGQLRLSQQHQARRVAWMRNLLGLVTLW